MNRTTLLIVLAALTAACSDPVAPLLWFDRIETPATPTGRLALTSPRYGVDVFDMTAGSFVPVDINWSPDGEWLVGPSFPGARIRLVHLASGEGVMLNTSVGGFLSSDWTSH